MVGHFVANVSKKVVLVTNFTFRKGGTNQQVSENNRKLFIRR